MSFDYRMTDVLPLVGIDYPMNRTSFYTYCPVCDVDYKNKHLNINLRKDTFRCPRCGDVQGGVLDLYALYANCSRGEAYRAISDRYEVRPQRREQGQFSHTGIIECDLAPVEKRDAAYRALISMLSITPEHIQNLHDRGLDDEQISHYGFRSVVPEELNDIGSVLSVEGYSLNGVPGFYMSSGRWFFRCDFSGILIPVLDTDGYVQGLQLRLDNTGKRKFRWISSGGLYQGTPARSFAHFIGSPSQTVLLTEGPMKADIINALSGLSVIAVPGVNCLSMLEPTLRKLRAEGTRHIRSAFDMDFLSNPHVQNGYQQLCCLLNDLGLSYGTQLWDPKYNGLDDYLNSIMN